MFLFAVVAASRLGLEIAIDRAHDQPVNEIVVFLYFILWPRHSPLIAAGCLLAALLLGLVWRRRRTALVLLACAATLVTWFALVRLVPRNLDVGQPDRVIVEKLGPSGWEGRAELSVAPTDLLGYFRSVRVVPGCSKVLPRYRVCFVAGSSHHAYRVTEFGTIANDIGATAIQDLYCTRDGLPELLERILSSRQPAAPAGRR